ncbi:hypothetical protein EC07798_1845 [Escherichia coli 07798]|nr:hypothetical protein ECTW07793_2048 [Escherichia coli TW07793]EKI42447.1 hypothetical protein EC07798_1845 [Escherichia coli 07798]KDZ50325.1 hypothetical protein AB16_2908 [Escherichia coli 3-073-06_S1_C1]KEM76124.1 hypothetical protein AC11_2272 [Escherichia coli 6-537-08_S3_C1]KEM83006.1 hypothetical protein AC64_2275 [Escherichia coli 6-537-08_S3_C3]KEN17355.1 hypothetical protein AC39_2360 [Escherichia coli 6-537-08_S3_C2]
MALFFVRLTLSFIFNTFSSISFDKDINFSLITYPLLT